VYPLLGSFWALSAKDNAELAMNAEWIERVERKTELPPTKAPGLEPAAPA